MLSTIWAGLKPAMNTCHMEIAGHGEHPFGALKYEVPIFDARRLKSRAKFENFSSPSFQQRSPIDFCRYYCSSNASYLPESLSCVPQTLSDTQTAEKHCVPHEQTLTGPITHHHIAASRLTVPIPVH
jgi:hypothetical protein